MGKPSCDETTYGPGAATSGVALRLHAGSLGSDVFQDHPERREQGTKESYLKCMAIKFL